jgi:hypothetical protein
MEVQVRISVSDNTVHPDKANLVYELSNQLNNYFANYNYDSDVKKVDIGFLLVLERPGYEVWYKPKKPKYVEYQNKTNLAGEEIIIEKTFSYEIRFSDEQLYKFTGGDDSLSKKVMAIEILKSLSKLDEMPKKVKNFDKAKFKSDIEQFFKEQNLL